MQKKVVHGNVEITVQTGTVRDDLHAKIISQRLRTGEKDGSWGLWDVFGELCSQSVEVVGLPFDPVNIHLADDATLKLAYDCFMSLPKKLKDKWIAQIAVVDDEPESNSVPNA